MKSHKNLFPKLCLYGNLYKAYKKARKGKSSMPYVIKFEKNLENNLLQLKKELESFEYKPFPLTKFIIRDPKTRVIRKSNFRDRIIHHTVFNILEPIFDKTFICDSYANRKNKGTLKALQRFDFFKRKVSKNNTRKIFILKADIKHYFEEINHEILIKAIKRKIKDNKIIWLIKQILKNYMADGRQNKGIPLGNLTSQFFANIYLNELDYFIKHKLKAKYYLRYVDDFVILYNSEKILGKYKEKINQFLKEKLELELHQDKSKIKLLNKGIKILGFRIFYYHKLLRKRNIKAFKKKLVEYKSKYNNNKSNYDKTYARFEGFLAHIKHADTYNLRRKIIKSFKQLFPKEISQIEINRYLKVLKE